MKYIHTLRSNMSSLMSWRAHILQIVIGCIVLNLALLKNSFFIRFK